MRGKSKWQKEYGWAEDTHHLGLLLLLHALDCISKWLEGHKIWMNFPFAASLSQTWEKYNGTENKNKVHQ